MPKETAINLTAVSKIQQDDQIETIETMTTGTATDMANATYIRYVEETAVDDTTLQTNVTIKLAHDNTLQIRRSGAANARLTFDLAQPTTTHYRTAVGNLVFDIHTTELSINPTDGTCHVAYTLKTGDETLGHYDFSLQYNAL